MRNIAFKRHNNHFKKKRKMQIIKDCYGGIERINSMKTGTLIKGKVHCSCSKCSNKTKTNGFKHSDKKKIIDLRYNHE